MYFFLFFFFLISSSPAVISRVAPRVLEKSIPRFFTSVEWSGLRVTPFYPNPMQRRVVKAGQVARRMEQTNRLQRPSLKIAVSEPWHLNIYEYIRFPRDLHLTKNQLVVFFVLLFFSQKNQLKGQPHMWCSFITWALGSVGYMQEPDRNRSWRDPFAWEKCCQHYSSHETFRVLSLYMSLYLTDFHISTSQIITRQWPFI
jgi:hypothetical protein